MSCELKLLSPADIPQAACLLSQAMLDNPLHIAVFGADKNKRFASLNDFFNLLLPMVADNGFLYGAYKSEQLAGVLGVMRPGSCHLPIKYKLELAIKVFKYFDFIASVKASYWLGRWHWHDLKIPHWHLGPLAVSDKYRQQGIAARLLEQAFTVASKENHPLWLETDKQLNVDFYKRRGFKIKKTIKICQTINWLMIKAAPAAGINNE